MFADTGGAGGTPSIEPGQAASIDSVLDPSLAGGKMEGARNTAAPAVFSICIDGVRQRYDAMNELRRGGAHFQRATDDIPLAFVAEILAELRPRPKLAKL